MRQRTPETLLSLPNGLALHPELRKLAPEAQQLLIRLSESCGLAVDEESIEEIVNTLDRRLDLVEELARWIV